jgi:hypothetical protein
MSIYSHGHLSPGPLPLPSPDQLPAGIQSARNWWETTKAVALTASIAVAGGIAVRGALEADYELPSMKSTPLAAIGEAVHSAAEYAGPGLLAASAVAVGAFVATSSGRSLWKLAQRGVASTHEKSGRTKPADLDALVLLKSKSFPGVASVEKPKIEKPKRASRPSGRGGLRKAMAGALVPAAGITALSVAFMIQDEVGSGPNRAVTTVVQGATARAAEDPAHNTIMINWQSGTKHFMESSVIPANDITRTARAVQAGQVPGVKDILPFKADLTEIPTRDNKHQAGLVLGVMSEAGRPSSLVPEVRPGAICTMAENKCILGENQAVVDAGEGLKVGDHVEIRGQDVTVVGLAKTPQSLMNRLVMFKGISEEDLRTGYSGFATVAHSQEDAEAMLDQLKLEGVEAETTQELLDQNRDFWERNGTPLIMLMVGDTLMLAGFSFAAIRRGEKERSKPHIAALRAMGASCGQIAGLQHGQIALQTAKAIVPAAITSEVLTMAINSLMTGFHGQMNATTIGASAGIVLLTQVAAGLRIPRKDGLSDYMRQH